MAKKSVCVDVDKLITYVAVVVVVVEAVVVVTASLSPPPPLFGSPKTTSFQ